MASYQVLFSGELVEGAVQEAVQANLARELGVDARKSQALFSGRTVVLKSQLSEADAMAMQARMGDLGALCRIKNLEAKTADKALATYKKDLGATDHTLRDITAAHLECPRCSHLQLDSSHCARCGVDMAAAFKQKRKEDLIIEKKIKALRTNQSQTMPVVDIPEQSIQFGQHATEAANDDNQKGRLGKMVNWLRRSGS